MKIFQSYKGLDQWEHDLDNPDQWECSTLVLSPESQLLTKLLQTWLELQILHENLQHSQANSSLVHSSVEWSTLILNLLHHLYYFRLSTVNIICRMVMRITCPTQPADTPGCQEVCGVERFTAVFSTLIGREVHSVSTPALLCHKEAA